MQHQISKPGNINHAKNVLNAEEENITNKLLKKKTSTTGNLQLSDRLVG
jgi:hypothetical protein